MKSIRLVKQVEYVAEVDVEELLQSEESDTDISMDYDTLNVTITFSLDDQDIDWEEVDKSIDIA